MSKLKRLRQRGDTIVEVMVCMAIVSFSLSSCYALARLSLNQVRDAEERSQSTQLAQMQLERLKAFLNKYPKVTTTPKIVDPSNGQVGDAYQDHDWILYPDDPALGVSWSRQQNSSYVFPGFCIFNDLSIYFTFNSKDPHCAVTPDGKFFCDPDQHNHCTGTYPSMFAPGDADNTYVDNHGYFYRAGAGTLPFAISGAYCSSGPTNCAADDQFAGLGGRYEAGGEGSNAYKLSVVSIPYRIHQ